MSCIITYKEKKYTHEEFSKLLHDDLYETLIKDGVLDYPEDMDLFLSSKERGSKTYNDDNALYQEALDASNNLSEEKRIAFQENPDEIMEKISIQLQSPETEEQTRETYGDVISDIALKMFPAKKTIVDTDTNKPKKERGASKTFRTTKASADTKGEESNPAIKELREKYDQDRLYYDPISNQDSIDEAFKAIEKEGVDAVKKRVIQANNNRGDWRKINAESLLLINDLGNQLDQARSEGNAELVNSLADEIADISEKLAERLTLAGQSTQIMAVWARLTPEGTLRSIEKGMDNYNHSYKGTRSQKRLEKQKKRYKKAQKEAAENVASSETIKALKEVIGVKVSRDKINKIRTERKSLLGDIKKTLEERKQTGQNLGIFPNFKSIAQSKADLDKKLVEQIYKLAKSYIDEGILEFKEWSKKVRADLNGIVSFDDVDLQVMFNDVTGEFGDLTELVKKGLKEANQTIDNIIVSHFTEREETKQDLINRLVSDVGLPPEIAEKLAKSIETEFNKQTQGGAAKLVEKYFGKAFEAKFKYTKEEADQIKKEKKEGKSLVDEMNRVLNMNGLLSDELIDDLFSQKFGIKRMTAEQKRRVLALSEAIQKSKGKFKEKATKDMMNYIGRIYGTSFRNIYWSLWYASVLSGLSTQVLNIQSNASNVMSVYVENVVNISKWYRSAKYAIKNKDAGIAIQVNPITENMARFMALVKQEKGLREFVDVLSTGAYDDKFAQSSLRGSEALQNISPFESKAIRDTKFGKYSGAEIAKYVSRFLAAQDAYFTNLNYESEYASAMLWENGKSGVTGNELAKSMLNEIYQTDVNSLEAKAQVDEEVTKYEQITGDKLSANQKKIRYIEILRESRSEEAEKAAKALAENLVFKGTPRGGIGIIAEYISMLANTAVLGDIIFKQFFPFTGVVSNVFNYMMDYTPIYGLLRANGWSFTTLFGARPTNEGYLDLMKGRKVAATQLGAVGTEQYYSQMGRAWFGLMSFSMLAYAILAASNDDDDETEGLPWGVDISDGHAGLTYKESINEEKARPKYSITFGNGFVLNYKNIPSVNIVATLIGSYNDLKKYKPDEADTRLFSALMASRKTFLDQQFVSGVQDLSDIFFSDKYNSENKWNSFVKQQSSRATAILPQNFNLITQIEDIMNPEKYEVKDLEDIIQYSFFKAAYRGRPTLDVAGDPIEKYPGEDFMPIAKWVGLKKERPFWRIVSDNSLTLSGFSTDVMIYDPKSGEEREMTEDERYKFQALAGKYWSELVEERFEFKTADELDEYLKKQVYPVATRKSYKDIAKLVGADESEFKDYILKKRSPEIEAFKKGKQEYLDFLKKEAADKAYYDLLKTLDSKINYRDSDWKDAYEYVNSKN